MLSQLDLSAGFERARWKLTLLFSLLHPCTATDRVGCHWRIISICFHLFSFFKRVLHHFTYIRVCRGYWESFQVALDRLRIHKTTNWAFAKLQNQLKCQQNVTAKLLKPTSINMINTTHNYFSPSLLDPEWAGPSVCGWSVQGPPPSPWTQTPAASHNSSHLSASPAAT